MTSFYCRSRRRGHRNRHHHQQYMLIMSVHVLIILTYIFACSSLNVNVTNIFCFVFFPTLLTSS
jgi:hypothetical protein